MELTTPCDVAELNLPPGFRFYPTDEELLLHYLCPKVAGQSSPLKIIGDVNLYKYDPWLLPGLALFGEKEWYFFSPRDRKYPNGSRPNRVAGSGYWKATGTDKLISAGGKKVGIKKALVFYVGKAPKGNKTNWIMHEYRLFETTRKKGSIRLDDWVLCRIYKKATGANAAVTAAAVAGSERSAGYPLAASQPNRVGTGAQLPETNDGFFSVPRVNSLKFLQEENQDLLRQRMESFDWVGRLPEIGSIDRSSGVQDHFSGLQEVPPLCQAESAEEMLASSIDEEVATSSFFDNGLTRPQQGLTQWVDSFAPPPYPPHLAPVNFASRQ